MLYVELMLPKGLNPLDVEPNQILYDSIANDVELMLKVFYVKSSIL